MTSERTAEFAFLQPSRPRRRAKPGNPLGFECRLDGEGWDGCRSPLVLRDLDVGPHRFEVRAVAFGRSGRPASAIWRIRGRLSDDDTPPSAPETVAPPVIVPVGPGVETPSEGKGLAIEVDTSGLEPLLPGAPAQPLPLTVTNPSSKPVRVSALTVTATTPAEGCDAVANFELTPAGIGPTLPLEVPAAGAVSLPASGIEAPTIGMPNLPYSQDACQGAEVDLQFSAEAEG